MSPIYVLPPGRYTLLDGLYEINIARKIRQSNEFILTHTSASDDNQPPPVHTLMAGHMFRSGIQEHYAFRCFTATAANHSSAMMMTTNHFDTNSSMQPTPSNLVAAPIPSRQQLPSSVVMNLVCPAFSSRPIAAVMATTTSTTTRRHAT